jgi:tetratricopeptide (TPR) repeat protein
MARKRVNKSLVAFLTVMAILLTVVVVAIATSQGAGRNPEVWAQQARERQQRKDYELALQLFNRAYRKSKNPSYLLEASRCAYQWGEVGEALGLMQRIRAELQGHPDSPVYQAALAGYLEYVWDVVSPQIPQRLTPDLRSTVLEYAQELQQASPQNVLGPVSEAVARFADEADPLSQELGEKALERAIQIDENDTRVVLARLAWEQRKLQQELARLQPGPGADAQRQQVVQAFSERARQILKRATDAYPTAWRLVAAYVRELASARLFEEAQAVCTRALEQDASVPELHTTAAALCIEEAQVRREELSPQEYAELLDRAARHADQAAELSPAIYQAYVLRAQAEWLRDLQDEKAQVSPQRLEAALKIYDQGLTRTATERSLHATLGAAVDRPLLHINAFNTALQYWASSSDAQERQRRLEWLQRFLSYAETRYPEEPFTYYLRGLVCMAQDQVTPAIQALEQAEQRAEASRTGLYPGLWLQAFGGMLPSYRLALLYREEGQPGEALRNAERAIGQYLAVFPDRPPPLSLAVLRVDLMGLADQPAQQILDYIAEVRRVCASELAGEARSQERLQLAAAEARALQRLGRTEEARRLLESAGGQDVRGVLVAVNAALAQQDLDNAVRLAREALERPDLTAGMCLATLRALAPALVQSERHDEAQRLLELARRRFADDAAVNSFVNDFGLMLSYRDPAQLEAHLKERIAAEPDATERARRYFQLYVALGKFDEAAPYLDQLEAALPDDLGVLNDQFTFALRNGQFDRAARYAARLAQANGGRGADNAGGATYRGRLALAQGQAEEAVREFRQAQSLLPRSAQLEVNLAQALLMADRVDEAIEALQRAISFDPNNFEACALLDDTYLRRVNPVLRPVGWESYLERAAKLRPKHPYVVENADRLDPQTGIRNRERRRAENPTDVDNLVRLAQLYASPKVNDPVRAAERFREAMQIDPGNALAAQAAAAFYALRKDRAGGEEHLRAYLQATSGRQRAYACVLLANFYAQLGDAEAAEAAYEQARRVAQEEVTDPQERRQTLRDVELDLLRFYRTQSGKEAEMIVAARWVLDRLDPNDPADRARIQYARISIIRGLLVLNRLGDAEREIGAYLKAYPDDISILPYQAQLHVMRRDWDAALAVLNQLVDAAPGQVWALSRRGALALQLGQYEQAYADLVRARSLTKEALERVPADQRGSSQELKAYLAACSDLARLYEVTERYELAESELREMMELAAAHPEAGEDPQQIAQRLIRVLQRARRLDKAVQIVSEFMARYPQAEDWPLAFASLRTSQANDLLVRASAAAEAGDSATERKLRAQAQQEFEAAAGYYERAVRLVQPRDPARALFLTGYQLDALASANRRDQAIELFERLRSAGTGLPSIIYAAMLRVYEEAGQREMAARLLQQALLRAMQEGGGSVDSVVMFAADHLPAEVLSDTLRGLIARAPAGSPEQFLLRGILAARLVAAGRPAEALEMIEPVLGQAPARSPERLRALLVREQALYQLQDIPGMIAVLEEILELYPDQATALNDLAFVLADEAGRPAEALPYAEKARELAPGNAGVMDTVGWVYFKNGRLERAEAAFKTALSLDPRHVAALYHYALLLKERGRLSEARDLLRQAQEAASSQKASRYAREIEEALESLRLP